MCRTPLIPSLFVLVLVQLICGPSLLADTQLTVTATTKRSIGGERELDRARYFNHWGTHTNNLGSNLTNQLTSPTGLNSVTGRETFEFDSLIAQGLSEDPANPGFFRQSDLVGKLQGNYRNWVLNGTRWKSLRENPNPVFVQSGRAIGNWPAWIREGTNLPIKGNGAAYANFLNVYLEEVVYGLGPNQGYLPFDKDRFYIEIMNEPQLELYSGITWTEVIEMHKTVTENVKAQFPQAKIGGASVGDGLNGPHRWSLMKDMMDDMASWDAEFDFWSIHPYECYHVQSNGVVAHQTRQSPGHLNALMDLFETHSQNLFGEPKEFAVTEYGAWVHTSQADGSFGSFGRRERQWTNARDTIEKLMVFLERPDRIANATPFIAPQWFTESSPTEESGAHHAMWERTPSGAYIQTVLGNMYRLYNDVAGDIVSIENDDRNLQSLAYRDGDQVHILLNNLRATDNTINLDMLAGLGSITQASLSRLFWNGTQGVYEANLNVLTNWQDLTLLPSEAAVLTLTVSDPSAYTFATDEVTYYGDQIQTAIGTGGISGTIDILGADTQDALSAIIRVGYSRSQLGSGSQGEGFELNINGTMIEVPDTGIIGFDDNDTRMAYREIEVPLELIQDGTNSVFVDFIGQGGELLSATLVLTKSLGDFNGSGAFDGEDLALLFDEFGIASPGSRYDLDGSGVIDDGDIQFWSEELRGIATPTGDFNGDGVVDAADYTTIRDLGGLEFEFNYQMWRNYYGQSVAANSQLQVPEPTAIMIVVWGLFAAVCRIRSSDHAT